MYALTTQHGQSVEKMSLQDYLHPYLTILDSQKTKSDYQGELRMFFRWIDKPIQDVTPLDVIEYRRHLEERGLKSSTVHKKLSVLRSFYLFLHQTFNIPNPTLAARLPKITDQSTKAVLSLQEVGKLLSVIDTTTTLGLRDKAILGLLLVSGLRTIEVSRASIGDIHEVDGFKVLKVHGKGNKMADSKLRADLYTAINDYLATRESISPDESLFLSIGNFAKGRISPKTIQARVRHYFELSGVMKPNLCCHSLRSTCAVLTISIGNADLIQVQRLLRHGDPRTTLRYVEALDSLRNNGVDRNPIAL